MKQCPECHELFEDDGHFCDIDGSPLVGDLELRQALIQPAERKSRDEVLNAVGTMVIGALFGVVLTIAAYTFFVTPNTSASNKPSQSTTQISASKPNQMTNPVQAEHISANSAASPSPSAEPTQESAPAATSSASQAQDVSSTAMNQGPISTGVKSAEKPQTLIQMKDGSTVEADAAWEDSQGIWYRRGGLVSFVDRKRVEKVTGLRNDRDGSGSEAGRP